LALTLTSIGKEMREFVKVLPSSAELAASARLEPTNIESPVKGDVISVLEPEKEVKVNDDLADLVNKFSTWDGFWEFITDNDPQDMVHTLVEQGDEVLAAIALVKEFAEIWKDSTWNM
jgi:hypothetical protein